MISFSVAFVAIAAAFAIPALLSLCVVFGSSRAVSPRYISAFALGVYFWFFSDTLGDSAYLGVNSGFSGGVEQAALLVFFAAGVLVLFYVDRKPFLSGMEAQAPGLGVPLLVALAVGIHGLGEGAAFTSVAASTPAQDILSAFGGLAPAVAFVIHKTLEPVIVGAAYVTYARDRTMNLAASARDLVLLAVVFVLPGLLGAATGYWLSYDTTYVFALGLGTSIYAAVRLAKPLFISTGQSRWDSTKVALAMVLGFLSLYFAALFHS